MNILEEIVLYKKQIVEEKKRTTSLSSLITHSEQRSVKRDFKAALKLSNTIALIAEIKKASPSAGMLRKNFDPVGIAQIYEEEKSVNAISILTEDKYFLGDPSYLESVSTIVSKPILCKDFIIDEYQIVEAASLQADAVLLISSILNDKDIKNMLRVVSDCGLCALIEAHTHDDIKRALDAGADIIGINNRDLTNFSVDISTTEHLINEIPNNVVKVSESGIRTHHDIVRLKECGVHAALIGEHFMRADNIKQCITELMMHEQ